MILFLEVIYVKITLQNKADILKPSN